MTADEERALALSLHPVYWLVADPATAVIARDAYRKRFDAYRGQLCLIWPELSDWDEEIYGAGLMAMKREAE